jgi:hypothetical protein
MSYNNSFSYNILEFKKYLFDDVFNYFREENFENERYRYISKKGVLGNVFLNLIIRFCFPFFLLVEFFRIKVFNKNKGTIFFYADTQVYADIVKYLSFRTTLIVNNPYRFPGSILDRISNNIFYLPLLLINRDLIVGFETNNNNLIDKSVNKLVKILKKSKCNIIVLNDSIYPINRALIYISKNLNIKTVEIQHAIYPSDMKLISGIGADFVFVWGNYFKNMYINQLNLNTDKVKVLGYPFNIAYREKVVSSNLVVYYLAQGFHLQDIKNLDILLSNALQIRKICIENNMIFKCRLHPNSPQILLDKILPHIECTPNNESLNDALTLGDIFISFNSTSLIQAALQGKYCIQLNNIPVVTDDFEKLGICPKSFSHISDLSNYLKTLSKLKRNDLKEFFAPIDDNYVFSNKIEVGERFLNLINQINF